jgi:hypothetical protein
MKGNGSPQRQIIKKQKSSHRSRQRKLTNLLLEYWPLSKAGKFPVQSFSPRARMSQLKELLTDTNSLARCSHLGG